MIKDIVVNLPLVSARPVAIEYALSVAKAFDAHLSGLAFIQNIVVPGTLLSGMDSVALSYRESSRKEAEAAVRRFNDMARGEGLEFEGQVVDEAAFDTALLFGRMARTFDLAIVGQPDPEAGGDEEVQIESALFDSGRPVLVVPYIHSSGLKVDRILACWDGSRNAARAIADALPFLKRAQTVEVVTIASNRDPEIEIPGVEISRHLARHGITVELRNIVTDNGDIANRILSHAADCAADMIIMGGYGHSRLREFVLGGATQGMIDSMTVPTLMSH